MKIMGKAKKVQEPETNGHTGTSSDKETADRVRRHLTDENDEITAEDIRNVKSDIRSDGQDAEGEKNLMEFGEEKDESAENEKKDKLTPWDIVE
jgi:hypothetical protein